MCVRPETTFRSSGAKEFFSGRPSYKRLAPLWPGFVDRTLETPHCIAWLGLVHEHFRLGFSPN